MITGDIDAIKRMVMNKLCKAENPIDFMSKVCDAFNSIDDIAEDYDSTDFKKGTKKILEDAFKDIDNIDDLRAYLWMVHNSYVSACMLASMTK